MNSVKKQFNDITPNEEWKSSLKSELVSFAHDELLAIKKENIFESFGSYFQFHHFAKAVAITSLVLMTVTGGSVFTVSAAKDSLPGDTLYSVKRMGERVQNAVTYQPEAKVRLKLNFAKIRLNEAQEIAKVEVVNDKSKQRLDEVMVDFQAEIEEAQKYLDEIRDTEGEISEEIVAELAYYNVNEENDNVEIVDPSISIESDEGEIAVEIAVEIATTGNIEILNEVAVDNFELTEIKNSETVDNFESDVVENSLLVEVNSKAKEYRDIFDELKESELMADDGIEIDKAIEATAKLVDEDIEDAENAIEKELDGVCVVDDNECGEDSVEDGIDVSDDQSDDIVEVKPVMPKVQGFMIREE